MSRSSVDSNASRDGSSVAQAGTSLPHLHVPHLPHLPHPSGELIDAAANPLGILALVEEASRGIGPKLIAGGLSCMIISGILNPMDVIKVRLQTQAKSATPKYTSFSQTAKTIFAEEGYRRGLMRGFTPSMMREASYSSLRMGLYDGVKIMIAPNGTDKNDFTLTQKLTAGCISGALGSVLATPTDLVKIRFQGYSLTNPNPHAHSFAAFSSIYSSGGLAGLYRGATPTIARAAILTGSQLSSYDHSKRVMLRSGAFQDNPTTHLIASIISGLVTTTATNPVDVIKTRVMNDANNLLYKNPLDCLLKTLKEGPKAFMKGWVPNYLRLGPHFIVSLPLAEYIRVKLGADSF